MSPSPRRTWPKPEDAAADLASHAKQGAQTFAAACDVTEPEQLDALGSAAVDRFGRIDIWINNAGLALTGKPVLEISPVPLRAHARHQSGRRAQRLSGSGAGHARRRRDL